MGVNINHILNPVAMNKSKSMEKFTKILNSDLRTSKEDVSLLSTSLIKVEKSNIEKITKHEK